MGKRFWGSTTLSLLLQPVVTNRFSKFKTFLQITIFHRVIHLFLIMSPDTSVVVSQQFQTDTNLVSLYLICLIHRLMGLS